MRTHQDKLHQSRKLVLMVDLDNTLIHTTEVPCEGSLKKVLCVCQVRKWDLRDDKTMLWSRLISYCNAELMF